MVRPTESKVIIDVKEARKLFNELRNSFSREEIKDIRGKLHKKEAVYNILKEKEQKTGLSKKEKNVLERISEYFNKLNNDLSKLKRHRHNIIHDPEYKGIEEIKYLFNNINEEDYYEPIKMKHAFDYNYIEYESRGDKYNNLSLEEYLNIIRPYLRDMIDNHKALGEWKIQLIMRIISVFSLDINKIHIMRTKSDNIELMSGTRTNDVINKLFKSFLRSYQEGLETKMKGSGFIFERVDLLEYHLHKISLNRGSSYIKSPEWLINKHGTINPQNTDNNRCLQYGITAALHHKNITHHPERIINISPFINNYNWKDIEFPSNSKDWKKFEQNNKTIALNILFVPYNTKQMRQAYISKYNSKLDSQVILLMITDGEKWHYLAVKNISRILRGITSNHDGDFYCLNCFNSYATKKRLKKHERICRDHDFCYLKMPDENNKILKYIQGEKLLKVPFIIYADLECLLQKIDTCKNNPEKS